MKYYKPLHIVIILTDVTRREETYHTGCNKSLFNVRRVGTLLPQIFTSFLLCEHDTSETERLRRPYCGAL